MIRECASQAFILAMIGKLLPKRHSDIRILRTSPIILLDPDILGLPHPKLAIDFVRLNSSLARISREAAAG